MRQHIHAIEDRKFQNSEDSIDADCMQIKFDAGDFTILTEKSMQGF